MSKVKENNVKDAEVIKDKLDPKEAKEALRTQLKTHLEQENHHKMMALKAQGALEVLDQLHPEKDQNDS